MAHEAMPWHKGELQVHQLLASPEKDNPTSPFLTPFAATLIPQTPLLAIGTLDDENRPWTSLWGGEPGFSRPISRQVVGIRTSVAVENDPVMNALFGQKTDGEVVQGNDKIISALNIDFQTRRRVKLAGKFAAGAVSVTGEGVGEIQMAFSIEQSLANCPKYLNRKELLPHAFKPLLISDTLPLPEEAIRLVRESDVFFLSTSQHHTDMDTNHRGGSPGFVRVISNTPDECVLIWPEYSGNRLYQTLGNLQITPKAGLVFPNFTNGDMLYLTGETEILIGNAASGILPRCKLAVRFTIRAAVYVKNTLGVRIEVATNPKSIFSPYNPPIRLLASEAPQHTNMNATSSALTITSHTKVTSKIAHITFRPSSPNGTLPTYQTGQYAILSFANELDQGYSHMRDDDPLSLNEDWIRSFTIVSHTTSPPSFSLLIKNIGGTVTKFLCNVNLRINPNVQVDLLGFAVEFVIRSSEASEKKESEREAIAFLAAGIGITPLLAYMKNDITPEKKLKVFWTLRKADLDLVQFVYKHWPAVQGYLRLYVTGVEEMEKEHVETQLKNLVESITFRRIERADLEMANKWFVCVGRSLEQNVRGWVEERGGQVISEDFNY